MCNFYNHLYAKFFAHAILILSIFSCQSLYAQAPNFDITKDEFVNIKAKIIERIEIALVKQAEDSLKNNSKLSNAEVESRIQSDKSTLLIKKFGELSDEDLNTLITKAVVEIYRNSISQLSTANIEKLKAAEVTKTAERELKTITDQKKNAGKEIDSLRKEMEKFSFSSDSIKTNRPKEYKQEYNSLYFADSSKAEYDIALKRVKLFENTQKINLAIIELSKDSLIDKIDFDADCSVIEDSLASLQLTLASLMRIPTSNQDTLVWIRKLNVDIMRTMRKLEERIMDFNVRLKYIPMKRDSLNRLKIALEKEFIKNSTRARLEFDTKWIKVFSENLLDSLSMIKERLQEDSMNAEQKYAGLKKMEDEKKDAVSAAIKTSKAAENRLVDEALKVLGQFEFSKLKETIRNRLGKGRIIKKFRYNVFILKDTVDANYYFGTSTFSKLQNASISRQGKTTSVYTEILTDFINLGFFGFGRIGFGTLVSNSEETKEAAANGDTPASSNGNPSNSKTGDTSAINTFFAAGGAAHMYLTAPLSSIGNSRTDPGRLDLLFQPKISMDLPKQSSTLDDPTYNMDIGFELFYTKKTTIDHFKFFAQLRSSWIKGSTHFYRSLGIIDEVHKGGCGFTYSRWAFGVEIFSIFRIIVADDVWGPSKLREATPLWVGVQFVSK